MDRWINLAGDVWAIVFAASFALSIGVGVIQHRRGKEFLDTPLLPVMTRGGLYFRCIVDRGCSLHLDLKPPDKP